MYFDQSRGNEHPDSTRSWTQHGMNQCDNAAIRHETIPVIVVGTGTGVLPCADESPPLPLYTYTSLLSKFSIDSTPSPLPFITHTDKYSSQYLY